MKDAFIMATGLDCIFAFQKFLIKATFPFYDTSEVQMGQSVYVWD